MTNDELLQMIASLTPGSVMRIQGPEERRQWEMLQQMYAQNQKSAFQGDRHYKGAAQHIFEDEMRKRGADPRQMAQQQRGQMDLEYARAALNARHATYKALGVPEEAGDDMANLRRRQSIDESTHKLALAKQLEQQALMLQAEGRRLSTGLSPLPTDPFEQEDLWIAEGTDETFGEWHSRRTGR